VRTWKTCEERAVCDELRRKLLTSQLQEAQKLAPAAYMAAGLAHDFKNILTSVRLHADLLEVAENAEQWASSLEHIRAAATQATELVERLVEFARPRAKRAQVVDVARELDKVSKMLRRMVPSKTELIVEADAGRMVKIDPVELAQIVVNCVLNAGQALGGAGKIEVRAAGVQLSATDGRAFSPALRAGAYTLVSVSDSGPGMRRAQVQRAMTPFATNRRKSGGSGLGLVVVRGCAARARGGVRIVSHKARGTRIEIALPALKKFLGKT
jgi:signal transduction histidine kinase